jgi:hypothetical protein
MVVLSARLSVVWVPHVPHTDQSIDRDTIKRAESHPWRVRKSECPNFNDVRRANRPFETTATETRLIPRFLRKTSVVPRLLRYSKDKGEIEGGLNGF